MAELLENFIGGAWTGAEAARGTPVHNPATGEVLAQTPLSTAAEVDRAVRAAAAAFPAWRAMPAGDRVQFLFRYKTLLEENLDELARTITLECGKTYAESVGELRRGIENVETACGIPLMLQGCNSEDIARGIDEIMMRQPLGVVAAITPFNFPAMIPLWFLPYAIACGNTFILKPSERVPLSAAKLVAVLERTGLPAGVVTLLHGGRAAVEALCDHPEVRAVSLVGSSAVARHVYARAAASGKRAQCQGGAKNPVVLLPDADPEMTVQVLGDSAFGCAGQRCLAASLVLAVGAARARFLPALEAAARERVVGFGLEKGVETGPVISAASQARIEQLIGAGVAEGARVVVDGRGARVAGCEGGSFVRPTVLDGLPAEGKLAQTEIFGPVLSVVAMETLDEAIRFVNQQAYGNMACLFTQSGAAARRFRHEATAGNIGINLGVAAPMAYFPFTGWKGSFFGDLHAQGRDAVEFYTDKKVVVERWPGEWSRRF
ncbi:MAG TPA: CoA-acylating methylmalonate-semialdehyde dehydrogenase [Terriglobales bacterium]|nr:CoA-acylating methylmalonate-semialdehyde dehydrogenase [Terriglobales bacterium]